MSTTITSRAYAGRSAEDRRADRRRRLLDAALELFGTRGYASTRIDEICSVAGVATKHFYEAFAGREELLLALYAEVVEHHGAMLTAALADAPDDPQAHVRVGLEAAMRGWTADERHARLAFIEVVGVSPRVEEQRFAVIEGYAALLAADLDGLAQRGKVPARDYAWFTRALVGAFTQVVELWLLHEDRPSTEHLVDELARLYSAAVG